MKLKLNLLLTAAILLTMLTSCNIATPCQSNAVKTQLGGWKAQLRDETRLVATVNVLNAQSSMARAQGARREVANAAVPSCAEDSKRAAVDAWDAVIDVYDGVGQALSAESVRNRVRAMLQAVERVDVVIGEVSK